MKLLKMTTPLGQMIAIGDETAVYLLQFEDQKGLKNIVYSFTPGRTKPLSLLEQELEQYFSGELYEFKTHFKLKGTPFQKSVWHQLSMIPYGETRSYAEIANAIGKPTAFRAVAQANGANPISIAIPCHRVIQTSGELGGYAGGIDRKQSLIDLEKNI